MFLEQKLGTMPVSSAIFQSHIPCLAQFLFYTINPIPHKGFRDRGLNVKPSDGSAGTLTTKLRRVILLLSVLILETAV